MSGDVAKVTFEIELDLDAIRERQMDWWVTQLDIQLVNTNMPTWNEVYVAVAQVILGSGHYKRYCITAIDDLQRFGPLVKNLKTTPARMSAKQTAPVPAPPKPVKKAATGG